MISPQAGLLVLLIPIFFYLGSRTKNNIVQVLQLLFGCFILQVYFTPLLTIIFLPDYLNLIKEYTDNPGHDIDWILMVVLDIIAIQLGLLLCGILAPKPAIHLPAVNINLCALLFIFNILLTWFFKSVLSTGVYDDGNMTANPISHFFQPVWLMTILVCYSTIQFYLHGKKPRLIIVLSIVLFIIMMVLNGSRSIILIVFITTLASKFLVSRSFEAWEIRYGVIFFLVGISGYIIATIQRLDAGSNDVFAEAFFYSDSLFEAIIFAIVNRLGLIENTYQISNGLYNPGIYTYANLTSMVQSTFDLIIPGSYFTGVWSLSALNMVWLFDYSIQQLDTGWASINTPLYSVNYLYFGKFAGWIVTIIVVFLFARLICFCLQPAKQKWMFFYGIFLLVNFPLFFLTSFGYEYLIREIIFGAAFLWLWGTISTKKIKF